jgi:probable HAF family extracellular repeat protein
MKALQIRTWRSTAFSLAAIGLLMALPARADDRSFVFDSIDFPGATLTQAFGINAGGEVVGLYRDATGKQHGFLWSAETFTSIDFPGAAATDARGISPAGDIVGTYRRAGEPGLNFHGYLLTRQGEFFRVDFPGHTSTIAQRILADGTILGCYHDTDTMDTMHGMVAGRDGFNGFDMATTMHNGATPDGKRIAGWYTEMPTGRARGYLLDAMNFIPFDVPGSTLTQAWDINPSGDLAGFYRDAAGRFHGFVAEDWQFTAIDVPGATATRVFGINAGGDVTGLYVDASGTHGFVASRTHGHNR